MASSGSFNTSAYQASDGSRYLTFSWEEVSQNIANNTTTISWTLKGGGTSSQYIYSGNFKVVIAGKTVYSVDNSNRIPLKNGTVVTSGTYTFTHKEDGTQGFTASAEGGVYWYEVNCTGSGTFTLDTIARASQPSLKTYPESTQLVGEFGDTISIHMNRKSSAFTHTVRYEYGTLSGTCINAETGKAATGIGTGFKWKVPESFMDLIPDSTIGSGRIYVDTYNGSTLVGTKYTGFTATVPANVKPSASLSLDDITNFDQVYGSPVKGISRIKVTVTGEPSYSSPIASYVITANGTKYSGATATTEVLKTSGASPVLATVTDKRGRSATASYTMQVQDYTPPQVTALSAIRCNEDGTLNKRGTNVKVTFSGVVSPLGNRNAAYYYLKYKKTSGSTYTTINFGTSTTMYAPTNSTYIFEASVSSSYDVIVVAQDHHNTSQKTVKVPTGASIFSWRGFKKSDGTVEEGAGIGKVPEKANTLQVGWDAEFEGSIKYKGKELIDLFYPVGSIYVAYNHTNPGTLFLGTTWVRMENTFLWGCDASGTIGQTGGAKEVTLTVNQIPSHSHGSVYSQHASGTKDKAWYSTSGTSVAYGAVETGGGAAHNNMPPYTQVSIWRRTA